MKRVLRPSAILLTLALGSPLALSNDRARSGAAASPSSGATSKPGAAAALGDAPEFPRPSQETYEPKSYSAAEVRRICQKHEGEIIAYYADVYKVEKCQKRSLTDNKTIYQYLRKGGRIVDVEHDVIAALPEGEPLDLATSVASARGCKALAGSYVTFSSVDVYFVERCRKRIFPDWATYIKHREQRSDKKGEILALSALEFDELETGEPIPSIVDDIFAKMLSGDAGIDVIPVDEACGGLDGKIASYYSRVYRIERCRKREILAPDQYLKQQGIRTAVVKEMSGEQWLSLPDGPPIQVESKHQEVGKAKKL